MQYIVWHYFIRTCEVVNQIVIPKLLAGNNECDKALR
jgi:hypothetical protein